LHFSDVDKLLNAIYQLRESGNTVVIIEHNMDIINACDYIIDLGPGGGEDGGRVLFQGPIEDFENCQKSETAYYLRKHLNKLIRNSKVRNNKTKK
jgi:excinuclease ABC subunit A